MKKVILAGLLVIVAIILWAGLSVFMECTRTTSSQEEVVVSIAPGSSEKAIAKVLKDSGVIKYEISFRIKMMNSPYRGKLNYGEYSLYENMCIDDAIEALSKPSALAESVKVTIPEGCSVKMIADIFERKGLSSSEDFLKEVKEGSFDYAFISDIPQKDAVEYPLEGYLFPSTYFFDKDATTHEIIDKLLGEFEKQYNKVCELLPEGMTMNEAIIRASLIEREAKLDDERTVISGVIQNRLDTGMPLQIDASVVYIISEGMYDIDRVLYKDLEKDSPYNTYKYGGLPVGAICNPGIKSISAAMEPMEHKYLYYHTDTEKNDGSHIFSETYSQHIS